MPTGTISSFSVYGVSYKKTDASLRGLFALNRQEDFKNLYENARLSGISECFVISTCNRTEIYGFTSRPEDLRDLLCSVTEGGVHQFDESSYHLRGGNAVQHLFRVAAGLDSQILGDYEIIGQLKIAFKAAKSEGFLGPNLERLANEVIRATKKIRTHTKFSSGTVSVSFAGIQFIRDFFPSVSGKKILLIGTGKIGMHTCKNLADYLPDAEITLMNRTPEKAAALALSLGLKSRDFVQMPEAIKESDVIIVATGAHAPLVLENHFCEEDQKLVIDLSIPFNVAPEVGDFPGVKLLTVDELSKVKDETLQMRAAEIPLVENILAEHLSEFIQWLELRRHAPVLKAVKSTLQRIQSNNLHDASRPEEKIQQLVKGVAVKMKTHNRPGCHYIEAISNFMSPASGN